jgi:tetratricopeptide (TPR) repeat protein
MKKISVSILFTIAAFISFGQDAKQLHETAKAFMRQGDYANAILVLNRAKEKAPGDIAIAKDLAFTYYSSRDNAHALETINMVLDNDAADDQAYQIAGLIYKQGNLVKDAEKLYKKGIKKFSGSGPLYNDLGELLWAQKNLEAIKYWEKGIEMDPSYSKNYYNAAKYYFFTTDKVWSLLYGEIFINMEPNSPNAPEIKQVLVDGYKKLFSDPNMEAPAKEKNNFVKLYLKSMAEQSSLAATGINAETLSMIRARFILDWFSNKDAPPFKLFSLQQQFLREGLFEAYNQWLFGSSQNLTGFQSWITTHHEEYTAFLNFQKGRIFKIPEGEFYH